MNKAFELDFRDWCRKLRFKKYHLAEKLGITMPTLKERIENPGNFKWSEIMILKELGFPMIELLK
jgi:hypothetical protein